jgi:2-haloacid dehalogenase
LTERWATFDCYGTLIDWERGIVECFRRLWPEADGSSLLARYHEIEPQIQHGVGIAYREVLTEALRRIASSVQLPLEEADVLARSLPSWPPFPDVPESLSLVRERGWRTAVLSNTDPDLLDASIANIGVPFDELITVAEAGSYKPALGHWDAFFDRTGADRSRHVHVARSIYHDIEPAGAVGLRTVWINRAAEPSDTPRSAELPDLAGLADALDALVAA